MIQILRHYSLTGAATVGEMIARYAPSSDNNNVEAYIAHVCNETKYEADDEPDFDDQTGILSLIYAMSIHEQGEQVIMQSVQQSDLLEAWSELHA
jgi:hypothetical protein